MSSEFIYESAPFPSCHASTILEPEPGKLMCAWFGGTDEGAKDVAIWLARKESSQGDGEKWSAPEKIASADNQPCWNPVLFRERKSGEVHLYYKAGPSPSTWSGFVKRSKDGGKTFGESFILPAGLLGPIKNKPIPLEDGTIVAPTSVESYQTWACWMERSSDGGRTWTKHGPITHPKHPYGIIQPTLLTLRDGSLLALMRSRGIGQICKSQSKDGGITWTPAEAMESLPNPNAGIDAVTLQDGRHALVYNPVHSGRTPLELAISEDDGRTWKRAAQLETEPGEYSYPAIIQTANKMVHITYTWKRKRIRHQWFTLDELKSV